jgi:hypothetical protein
MYIQVFRVRFHETRTVGQLYIDGELFCFTLEDKMREVEGQPVQKWKVQDETAIPTGTYELTLEDSPRFGTDTPTLQRVPGFDYIRIHSGNTEEHTEGCLILGYKLNDNGTIKFGTTRPAVVELKKRIKKALQEGQKCYIEIKNVK